MLAALVLLAASLGIARLYPRKVLDIGWGDLFAAAWHLLVSRESERAQLDREVADLWSGAGDGFACLSVRTSMDLIFKALDLPQGSEVLFFPGITIPSVIELVESHGFRVRAADPTSVADLRAPNLGEHVTPETRVLIVTHLFGSHYDSGHVIKEAHSRGLFVYEDCAQAWVGAAATGGSGRTLGDGFRGHPDSDAAFVSLGLIKTGTALGGAVGCIRDLALRQKVVELHAKLPVRKQKQFRMQVIKAFLFKLVTCPSLWGLLSNFIEAMGVDFDHLVINSVRGFPKGDTIQQRPTVTLLHLMKRRVRDQHTVAYSGSDSSLAARRSASQQVTATLEKNGVQVMGSEGGTQTWWLLPIQDDDPEQLTLQLRLRGFDATGTSTQLHPFPEL